MGNETLRGRERSAQVRQWELLATKTIHCADYPRNTGQSRGRGENPGLAPGRANRVRSQVGQGFSDLGKAALKLWTTANWHPSYSGRWRQQRGTEKWSDGPGDAVGLEGTMTELKPESHLKHSSPNIHFFSNFYVSSH